MRVLLPLEDIVRRLCSGSAKGLGPQTLHACTPSAGRRRWPQRCTYRVPSPPTLHHETFWYIVKHRVTSTLHLKGVFSFLSLITVDRESQSGNSISEKPVDASSVGTIVNGLASVRTSAPKTVGNNYTYSVLVWVGLGELCCLWESKLD